MADALADQLQANANEVKKKLDYLKSPEGKAEFQANYAQGDPRASADYEKAVEQYSSAYTAALRATASTAPKPKDLSASRVEKLSDGWHVVETSPTGVVTVHPDVLSPLPGKTLSPGQRLKNAPDGLHNVNDDGTLGELVVPKVAKPAVDRSAPTATSASTNKKNDAQADLTQARIDAMKQTAWAGVQPKLDAIDKQFDDGTLTADQRDAAKKGVIDDAIASTVTGLTAAQRTTADQNLVTTLKDLDEAQMTQGNNRATVASSTFGNALTMAGKIAEAGREGGAAAGPAFTALLNMAPRFQAAMGGAPLSPKQSQALTMIAALSDQKGVPFGAAARALAGTVQESTGFTAPGLAGPSVGDLGSLHAAPAMDTSPAQMVVPSPTGGIFDAATQAQAAAASTDPGKPGWLPSFDDGGVVPGRPGEPVLAVVHGGETVLPTHRVDVQRDLGPGRGGRGFVVPMVYRGDAIMRDRRPVPFDPEEARPGDFAPEDMTPKYPHAGFQVGTAYVPSQEEQYAWRLGVDPDGRWFGEHTPDPETLADMENTYRRPGVAVIVPGGPTRYGSAGADTPFPVPTLQKLTVRRM
jgi:hypothetical protein